MARCQCDEFGPTDQEEGAAANKVRLRVSFGDGCEGAIQIGIARHIHKIKF
jgi:hypothetical protein